MKALNLPWMKEIILPWSESESGYCVTVNAALYSPEAILKCCYLFLDQCYLFVDSETQNPSEIKVYFSASNEQVDLKDLIGEFSNRLIWQEVRQKVARETQSIREMIVAQALTEANLADYSNTEADYNADPLGIAQ